MPEQASTVTSFIEILDVASGQRKVIYQASGVYEAPNWSHDGEYLIINRDGLLYKLDVAGGEVKEINTEFANRCNNDHGISPDGKEIVISHHDNKSSQGESIIYILPIEGGTPRQVTAKWPSYWHGWSPDGQTLAYVAGRNNQDFKIYSINVQGGEETQLTTGAGLDDGPEYSHDGKTIYYNSFRNNKMQIWRMDKDGKNPEQIVNSVHSDWFPHPSPDGKKVVFLRFIEDQGQGHPFGRDVQLMMLDLRSDKIEAATTVFFGGQGTINVPSWSPDGKQLAFVSYQQ